MNPRQRRGVLLVLATAVGAIVVFVAVLSMVADVRSQVGPTATVLQLTSPVDALAPITPDMLEEVEIPRRWISSQSLTSADEVLGLVAAAGYEPGTVLQAGMLVEPPGLAQGYREVAILVDAETGVAGKVQPGDRVDIIATIAADEVSPAVSQVWVENVLVIEVGIPQETEVTDSSGNFSQRNGVPVTFAVSVADAVRLAYAESFSEELRLALRGRGDESAIGSADATFTRAQEAGR